MLIILCLLIAVAVYAGSGCGDGVLSPREQCECADGVSKVCMPCKGCRLMEKHVECSSTFYVRKKTFVGNTPVNLLQLSSPECCNSTSHKIQTGKACRGTSGICGESGHCYDLCLYVGYPSCGNEECTQKCVKNGVCGGYLTYLQDGTKCHLSGWKGKSKCKGGKCLPI